MKKYLLLITFFLLFHFISIGQLCNYGLSPNLGARGQTLTTTITGTMYTMGAGTAPCNPSDVFLKHGVFGDTIYASTLSINNDSIRVSWNIPSNARIGGYDLNLDLYANYPPFGTCIVGPTRCTMPQRFGIGTSVISGMVYFDVNQDSVFNAGDIRLANRKLMLSPDSIFTFTDGSGNYTFFADTGAYVVRIMNDSTFNSVTSDSISLNVSNSNIANQDFGVYPSSASYNCNLFVSGRARCNTTQSYYFSYHNLSLFPVNLIIKIYHSSNTTYLNATVPPDSVAGDTIYFSFMNLNYGSGYFNVNFQIPAAGSIIEIDPVMNMFDINNNQVGFCSTKLTQTVTCSFDPNDKNVTPAGELPQHYTLFGEDLFYMIRFQNTGNDTAYTIRVLDTLDTDLDLNSFAMVSSSHPVIVDMGFDGIINFHFNNIMLPDSNIDEPSSHGFVSYTVREKQGLPEMTVVNNLANIYFDQNAPVVTNQTENTLVSIIPVGVYNPINADNIYLYPNPFKESIRIRIVNNELKNYLFTISDLEGRQLINTVFVSGETTVDLHELTSGVYLYKLYNIANGESYFGKLIKN